MRKHFLLLFLMALLPFTGWAAAEDINNYSVVFGTYDGTTFTEATAINYLGKDQNFPGVVLKKEESGSTTYLATGFTVTSWTYKGATVTKINEAGKYTAIIQTDGGASATLTGNITGDFTVGKAAITVTGKSITSGVTYGDALKLNGEAIIGAGSKNFEATYTFPDGFDPTTKTNANESFENAQVYTTNYTKWANVTTSGSEYDIVPVVSNLNDSFKNYDFTAVNGKLTVKAKTLGKTGWYSALEDHEYDGNSYMAEPKIIDPAKTDNPATTDDERLLTKGTDYTLTYYLANSDGKLEKSTTSGSAPYTNTVGTTTNTKVVGKYFVVIAGNGNYASPTTGAYEESYNIYKRVLGVYTKDGESTYGDDIDLSSNIYFKGNVPGETVETSATHDAGVLKKDVSFKAVMAGKNQGTYPVTAKAIKTTSATSGSSSSSSPAPAPTVTDVADDDVAANYKPAYINGGTWTIKKKEIQFVLKAQSITNGVSSELSSEGVQITATNFSTYFEALATGALAYTDKITTYPKVKLNANDQIVVEGTFTFNNGAAEDSEDYADVTNNYVVKEIAPVTVERKNGTLTISVSDPTIKYGDAPKALTVVVLGGTKDDNDAAKAIFEGLLSVAKTGTPIDDNGAAVTSATTTVTYPNAGIYNIVVGDYSKANLPKGYGISIINGTYTIEKRELKSINPIDQTVATNSTVTALEPASATTIEFVQKDGDAEKYPITDTDKRLLYEDIIAADATNHTGFAFKSGLTSVAAGKNADGIVMVNLSGKLRNFIALTTGTADVYGAAVAASAVVLDRNVTTDPTEADATKTVKTTIHSNKDKIANVKFGTRVLGSQKWNAFVLPFTISAADLSQAVGYAVFNVVDKANSDESHARFKLYMGIIEANTPFLMKTDKEIDMKDIQINGVQIVENLTPSVNVAGDIKFKGTYEQTLMKANNRWVVNDVWKEGTGKGGVLALTSYLEYPEGTNAPEIILEEADGSTTAISAITADGEAVEATGWYTLNGIQLQGAPTEKGVYVRNGKKVVIK